MTKTIKKLREIKGYTQKDLAEKTGLSLRTIQRLEADNKKPKGHTLTVLSQEFNMTPSELQSKFNKNKEYSQKDKNSIRIINLSILSFIGIPFGNLILPIILWRKSKVSPQINELAKRIINVQVLFSLILGFLLGISPFISKSYFKEMPLILYVLLLSYIINIAIVGYTARKLSLNSYSILNTPLRLL